MSRIVIDILMYVFAAFVFLYYSATLFEAKFSLYKRVAITVVGYAALYGIFLLKSTLLNFAAFILINAVLLRVMFHITLKSTALHAFILTILLLASDFIAGSLFSGLFAQDFNKIVQDSMTYGYGFVILFSKLLYFSLCIVSIRIFSKNENIKSQNYLSIIIVPISNCFIMLVFRYIIYKIDVTSTIFYLWIIAVGLLVATSFLVFIIYHTTIKKSQEIAELKIEHQQYEDEKKNFKIIQTANDEMRRISHDYKNQLTQIRNMNDVEEIRRYIKPFLSEVDTLSNTQEAKEVPPCQKQ